MKVARERTNPVFYVSGSRYLDGYHHLHDVLIGAALGSAQAYYCYHCMVPEPRTTYTISKTKKSVNSVAISSD